MKQLHSLSRIFLNNNFIQYKYLWIISLHYRDATWDSLITGNLTVHGIHQSPVDSLKNDQYCRKRFYVMTSLWVADDDQYMVN